MRRLLGSISKRGSHDDSSAPNQDSPEANVARGVRLFCESGGPNNSGEEVLHLPVIVEAAESSPSAAREAANVIRKFLSKDNYQRPYVQYNSLMLVRILADNPGKTFTRNIDSKFVITVKELLRDGRDTSVQQILRETLDTFEMQKPNDETLRPLNAMWQKEKSKMGVSSNPPMPQRTLNAPPFDSNQQQNYFARNHRPRGLPPPHELAQRIEEAKTSAKLLSQVVQSTSPSEILGNDLIKEFAERCQSASRSIQGYIHSEDPPPDDGTLLTLIETNDQLSQATSRHQHALLQARRVAGAASLTPSPPVGAPYGHPTHNGGPQYAASQGPSPAPPPPTLPVRNEPQYAPQPGPYFAPPEPYTAPSGPPPRPSAPQPAPPSRAAFSPEPDHQAQVLQRPLNYHSFGATTPPGPPPNLPDNLHPQPSLSNNSFSHTGYQPTPSYLQRQDSATENYTMRGASRAEEPFSPVEREGEGAVRYRF